MKSPNTSASTPIDSENTVHTQVQLGSSNECGAKSNVSIQADDASVYLTTIGTQTQMCQLDYESFSSSAMNGNSKQTQPVTDDINDTSQDPLSFNPKPPKVMDLQLVLQMFKEIKEDLVQFKRDTNVERINDIVAQ